MPAMRERERWFMMVSVSCGYDSFRSKGIGLGHERARKALAATKAASDGTM